MRNLSLSLLFIFGIIISSCNKNEPVTTYWYSYGTYFETDSVDLGFIIKLDNNDYLIPKQVNYINNNVTDSIRVILIYSIISEENGIVNAKVDEINGILTKGIIQLTEQNKDRIGNDGIIVYHDDIWLSDNHLNVIFGYYNYDTTHYINLVKPIDSLVDQNGRQILEFKHNANNDYASRYIKSNVSFNMWSLYEDGMDSINFVFKSVDYHDVEMTWEGTYFFNKSTPIKKMLLTTPNYFKKGLIE